jgi:hypothetical protein
MHKILKEISERAILLNEFEFPEVNVQTKWLGADAASKKEIEKTEKRLQIKLPDDYINFISSTNGFPAVTNVGITFLPIEKIDYLKNLDISLIEIWSEFEELKETSLALEKSILVGGLDEEQSFLLIPPYDKHKKWRYWHFAAWNPGEWPFKSLDAYFQHELKFLKKETKGLKFPKPKPVIDYTLRDYIFQCEWEKALLLSEELFSNQRVYPYCDSLLDLLKLYLICSSKMNRYDQAERYFQQLITNTGLEINENDILAAFKNAANQKRPIATRFDNYQYYPKEKNITSSELEQQIGEYRKDLLEPNNSPDKVNYELYFLFEYGDSEDFIKKYEVNIELVSFEQHLKAASIYSLTNKKIQSKESVIQYWNQMFKYRPFEPFFNCNILGTMDEDFLKNAYLKYQ